MDAYYFLVGPTAVGKTAVALELAGLFPAEIVSLDSMNVYRGMDIGTAKPSEEERRRVPHHLIDVADPDEPFSVGRYAEEAQRAAAGIRSRRKHPLFVGGTPLYLKTLVAGLFEGPPADRALRRELRERADLEGPASLHEELKRVDPVSAARIHPNNLKRVIRAIEVFRRTGRPISELQTQWSAGTGARPSVIAGIVRDRAELYRRIDARVEEMFARGLVDEVRALVGRYGSLGRTAAQALGYRETLALLAGKSDLATTIEMVKRNTRRMAKRQLTWFRSFREIRWFEMNEKSRPDDIAGEIARFFAAGNDEARRPNDESGGTCGRGIPNR